MKRKVRRKRDDIDSLNMALSLNGQAMMEGPKKKTWSIHDLKTIKPLTTNQDEAFHLWFENPDKHLALLGSAGTGKSYLSIYFAMQEILQNKGQYTSLKIVRSIVQTRQIGALPGTLEEKKLPIFQIYDSIFADLFKRKLTLENMHEKGLVEFIDTSYIRGSTWNNCIVFIDEINNMNPHEVHTVMTRVGDNTRVIIAGDEKQSDLVTSGNKNDKHDFNAFLNTIKNMSSINYVEFTFDDIVRSGFVKEWIIASRNY